jgi:hypothetical protein
VDGAVAVVVVANRAVENVIAENPIKRSIRWTVDQPFVTIALWEHAIPTS